MTGAKVHDSVPFDDLLDVVARIAGKRGRPRRRPDKLHAEKAYDDAVADAPVIAVALSRASPGGIEPKQKLGQHRWVIKRSFAWLNRFGRLAIQYERRLDIHHALPRSRAHSFGCAH